MIKIGQLICKICNICLKIYNVHVDGDDGGRQVQVTVNVCELAEAWCLAWTYDHICVYT